MKKLLLSLSIIGLGIASCDKMETIDVSAQKDLMDQTWQMTAQVTNANVTDTNFHYYDTYPQISACIKDNYYKFTGTNNVSLFDNTIKCVASAPGQLDYYYVLNPEENFIRIFSNTEDPENSVILQGEFKLVDINTFTVRTDTYEEDTERTKSVISTFSKVKN